MQLHIHSDASFDSEPKSKSRAGGFFTLGEPDFQGTELPAKHSSINGPIATLSRIIRKTAKSAAEAEYAALYYNMDRADSITQSLVDLGFKQQPTHITYDNKTAGDIANNNAKPGMLKAIARDFHAVQENITENRFKAIWKPGKLNIADFFTKAIPVHQHKAMSRFLISAA
jgi:hypothetical protein